MRPRFGTALVFAPDLRVAREFYVDVLGFSLVEATDRHMHLEGADFTLLVFTCEGDVAPAGHGTRPGIAIALEVDDLDHAMRELATEGVVFLHEVPSHGPFGRYAAFTDPFGTVHELIERPST